MKFPLKILIKIQELSTFHQFFGKEKFYFWKKNYRTCDDDVSGVCPCAPCVHDYCCCCCFCDVVAPRSNGCPNRTVNGTRSDGARNDATSANLNFQNGFGIHSSIPNSEYTRWFFSDILHYRSSTPDRYSVYFLILYKDSILNLRRQAR